jgi:hypothetical protein
MPAEFEVQKALYTAVSGLGYTAYDSAPQVSDPGAVTSWVEVGAIVMAPFDTKDRNGFDFVARLHTHSRSQSMKEAKDIQGAVYAALHHGTLTVTGYRTVLLRREQSDVTRAPDGSFHGVCEYRGLIESTS